MTAQAPRTTTCLPAKRSGPLLLACAVSVCGCGQDYESRPAGTPSATAGSEIEPAPSDPLDGDDWLDRMEQRVEEAIGRARESSLALEYSAGGARRVASGVMISAEGDVLSVRVDRPRPGGPGIVAEDASGRRGAATWVASDPETGLTLLRTSPGLARRASPSTRGARLGMPVLVVGNPFGLGHTVSRGSVSGLDRRLDLGSTRLGGLIQLDVATHPGDSGALVADFRGAWLGLIRSGLAPPESEPGADGQGREHDLGFAVPAAEALWVAEQLRAHGRVDRAYLGIGMGSPWADDRSPGVGVVRVLPDTPAAREGLKPGDRILTVDGRPVLVPNDVSDRLDHTLAGASLSLTVERTEGTSARRFDLVIQTTHRPAPPTPPAAPPRPAPASRPETAAVGSPPAR
ncbi:MAG: S1C family serine protease [Isosphaeraceae bacterium]